MPALSARIRAEFAKSTNLPDLVPFVGFFLLLGSSDHDFPKGEQKKMRKRNVTMILLCCIALLGLCGCNADAVLDDAVEVQSVTLFADAQVGGEFVYPYGEVTVASDAADQAGFTDGVTANTGVSALDVLVALHEELYGEAFTEDPAAYLVVEDGWIRTAFEKSTDSWSVICNGESAHSDEESSYGGFEALMLHQTEVADGDTVEFVAYQDVVNYADQALWFMAEGTRITALELAAGEEFSLNVQGYTYSLYGAYGTEAITNTCLLPVAGVQLGLMAADGSVTPIDGAVCDDAGNVTLLLPEAGDYTVVAYVPQGDAVAFGSVLTVTVQ